MKVDGQCSRTDTSRITIVTGQTEERTTATSGDRGQKKTDSDASVRAEGGVEAGRKLLARTGRRRRGQHVSRQGQSRSRSRACVWSCVRR
eukprot:446133-Rhodomonas_salina.2